MRRVLSTIDSISEWSGKVVSFLVLGVAGVMGAEIVARYVFDSPFIWSHETAVFQFGAMCILGGGYTLLHGAHVSVDVLHQRFPPKARAIIDLITAPLFFLFIGVMLWQGLGLAWKSVEILEYSTISLWHPPFWPFKLTLPIGAGLLLLQGLAKFARDLTVARTGRGQHEC